MAEKHSFWITMPGILTGFAAIITAIAGLLVAAYQTGILNSRQQGSTTRVVEETPTTSVGGESVSHPVEEQGSSKQMASPSTLAGGKSVTNPVVEPRSATESGSTEAAIQVEKMNLLDPENGGQILVATSDTWLGTIDRDGRDITFSESQGGGTTEAIYAFKDERSAVFDTFTVLITESRDSNLKSLELFWGNESSAGAFHGDWKIPNAKSKTIQNTFSAV